MAGSTWAAKYEHDSELTAIANELERLQAFESGFGPPGEPVSALFKCGKCGAPMHCGPKEWELQCECRAVEPPAVSVCKSAGCWYYGKPKWRDCDCMKGSAVKSSPPYSPTDSEDIANGR